MDPISKKTFTQDAVHVQPFARTKHASITLNQALMQYSMFVQPFARTKHAPSFESGPYAGLCSCSAFLPGLNMDPVLNQALMQVLVHVQPFATTKHKCNFETNPCAGHCGTDFGGNEHSEVCRQSQSAVEVLQRHEGTI